MSQFEQLEARRVLAAAIWNNVGHPVNVNGDDAGVVSPIDALLVINEINTRVASNPVTGELPRQVGESNSNRFYDVNCDNFVSPIDALEVINYINSNGQSGGTNGTGVYPNLSCSPQLLETGQFSEELSHELTLPDDSSAIKVHFRAPEFDTSSRNQIRDAFEIELTDQNGNQVSFPYAPGRDASYNWSEMLEPKFAGGVDTTTGIGEQDSTATIHLAGLDAGTRITVTARLVNNDGDEGSSVIIRGFEVVDSQVPAPTGMAGASERIAESSNIRMDELQDISGAMRATYGRTSLAGANNELMTDLVVTNIGRQAVAGQIVVAVDNVSELDVAAMHPDGMLPDGRPYWDLTHEMAGKPLGPGESIRSREIAFRNDSGGKFTYQLRAYGSLNLAPSGFVSTPLNSIEAGRTYRYQSEAVDPEGQALVYTKVAGPEAMQVDPTTGQVAWETGAQDIGSQSIILRATDPHGLYVEQSYRLQVVATLQNRPPVFVSDPVIEAIASSGFEVTTIGVGAAPAAASTISGFRGPRIVTANAADQTIGVYAGENNDRFDDVTEIATGHPRRQGEWFDAGVSLDNGFPETLTLNDAQYIDNFTQGDFNHDGALDFVVAYKFDVSRDSSEGTSRVVALFGDGNGAFGVPVTLFEREIRDDQSRVRSLSTRDLNGDGHLDVLVNDRRDGLLVSILGDGDGTFHNPIETVYGTTISDFKLADIDGDQTLDIFGRTVATNGFSTSLFWGKGNGDGSFEEPTEFRSTRNSDATGSRNVYDLADLDGDGDLDFVISGDNQLIQVFHNDGSGNFSLENEFDPPSAQAYYNPDWLQVADFNGDGNQDVLFYHVWLGQLDLMLGDDSGVAFTYEAGTEIRVRADNWATDFEPIDIDGDGDLDIAFGAELNRISPVVGLNDGSGKFDVTEYVMPDFSDDIRLNFFDATARGVLFGDYNSDGVVDLSYFTSDNSLSGATDENRVGIRFGTRPGEFGRTRTEPWLTPSWVDTARSGDFNGDSIPDLFDSNSDVIALGNGDGTFGDLIPATGIRRPSSTGGIADFNLDGLDDVVAGYEGGLYVGLSNGNGTLSVNQQITGGGFYGYTTVDMADFNLDGYMDFATKVEVSEYFEVYLNDPLNPGTFQMTFTYSLADGSQGVNVSNWDESWDLGDFTGDGIPDLITAERDATPELDPIKIVVFAGDGEGGFSRHSEFAGFDEAKQLNVLGSAVEPGDLVTGDIDNDGDLDALAYTYKGGRIFWNDGSGNFSSSGTLLDDVRVNQRGRDSWLFDLNQDGNLDFITAAGADINGSIHYWEGDGAGNFDRVQSLKMHAETQSGRNPFVDWDGDGHFDHFYTTGDSSSDEIAFNMGRRDDLVDLLTIDLNGDGNEEVLAVQEQMERLQVFVGDNLGGMSRLPDLQTGRAPQAVAAADLDHDGQIELLTANRAGRSITVFSGNLNDGFSSVEFPVGTLGRSIGTPIDVAATDINRDGHIDIVALDNVNNALWVYAGDGTATLSSPTAVPLGDTPSRFILADATGDSVVDAIVSLPGTQRLMILPDIGFQTGSPVYVELAGTPSDVAVLDLNDDGNPDLATTLMDSDALSIHYGLGNNQFARAQQVAVGAQPNRVIADDADEDGRPDLIVTNAGDDSVSVVYNRFDPNEVYRYDSEAVDPDSDPLTYSIVDGPGGLIINSESGDLLWAASPSQVGVHEVTIAADDGRGGTGTQSFMIEVVPARENSPPILATNPIQKIGAGETFSYQAQALDAENHTLRYSLVEGPEGATIDPVTGQLRWDNRSQSEAFGRGGQGGIIRIPADDTLRPESITIEGWFQPTGLPVDNYLHLDQGVWLYLHNRGQLIRAWITLEGESLRFDTPIQTELGRWNHIALTYDASTGKASVYVDGVLGGSATASEPKPLNTESGVSIVGRQGGTAQANFENYRLWNYARSGAEIQDGLSRHYQGDPRLLVDYRFEETDAISVHDYSTHENHGYRISFETETQTSVGLSETGSFDFKILVEDGRGGSDTQNFTLNVLPEVRGSIVGHLFDDLDGDGRQADGSEAGVPEEPDLAGWHLWIDTNANGYPDPHETQTLTDSNGNYRFEGLLPGEFRVSVSPVAGYVTPSDFLATAIPDVQRELDPGNAMSYDLAIAQLELNQIRGQLQTEAGQDIPYWRVYVDLDGDGTRAQNEPIAISDRNGNYALAGLTAGTYTIRPDLPAGWMDIAGRDGQTVTIAADEISSGNDFALQPTNTSVAGGLHFVTTPTREVEARQTFTYAAIAMGIGNAQITYDFSLAPEGMTVDPATGLVAWKPTIDQIGQQLVIIRATSSDGSIALQEFRLNVAAPNTAPVLSLTTHAALANAYVGLTYAIDLAAQDAENDDATFALVAGPSAAILDATSGALRWTPTGADVGKQSFSIQLTDAAGATSTSEILVDVLDHQPTSTPFNVTSVRSQIGLGQDFFSQLSGTDAIGRPLLWNLITGPDGMTVESNGTIRWTPTSAHLGEHAIELEVSSPGGEIERHVLSIEVVGRAVNSAPSIASEPHRSATVDKVFEYGIEAEDEDLDILAYALLDGPVGMSIHPSLGSLLWSPTSDQRGEHSVSVQVTDPDGLTDEQTFEVAVSTFGGPPKIRSIAPTEASVGIGYRYSVGASDAEGDPLTYRLLASPDGMTITETTGEINWTPTATQLGSQDVVVEVSDGIGGAATQAFSVRVRDGVPNLPPEFTTHAPRFGAAGQVYTYAAQATDPEATTVSYSLGQAPLGMSIDALSGLVAWSPANDQVGQFVVTIIATDEGGATAVESFELDILGQNNTPVILSKPPGEATAGAEFRYDILVRDADLDPLEFTLTESPAAARVDAFGVLTWQTALGDTGHYDFTVKVTDPRGGEATQSFTLELVADTEPPRVSLIENLGDNSRNILPWMGPFTVYAKAIDNVEVASLTLTANGQDIPLDAAGTAKFAFNEWFFETITATVTAVDTSGNISQQTISFDYDVPEGWSTNPGPEVPTAIITSPADNGTAEGLVSITGTADHADFGAYTLSYRRADETSFTEILRSTTPVVDGELGVWDTSLLLNEEYVIRLQVATTEGTANVVEHSVGLAGELKLGNFQLNFTDLVIPVSGIPVEVTRVYDTLQADREGDFGFGWRLEYRNTDLRVGLPKSGLEDIGIYSALRSGVKVFLNVPGEGRQGFTFTPSIRVLPGWGGNNLVLARPGFTPDPGVTSTLGTGTSSYLQVNERGELYAPGGIPYNPASPDFGGAYVLTTSAGITYRIDGATGNLMTATDRNGNRVRFTELGVFADEMGIELSFERDSKGRITTATDTLGNSVRYEYEGGDLVKVIDRESNETTFTYHANRPHYLDSVIDPLGRTGARYEYDDDGRLIGLLNSDGTRVEFAFDIDASRQTVRDRLGRETQVVYDNAGNVLAQVDALGGITQMEYDRNGNQTAVVDPLGNRTETVFDSSDRIVRQIDANGNVFRHTYDASGNPLQTIDPLGRAIVESFDDNGNVQSTKTVDGRTTEYSGNGDSPESVLLNGKTQIDFEYDSAGRVTRQISSAGIALEYEYDSNGNLLRTVETRDGNGSQSRRESTFSIDAEGRVLASTDTEGNTSQFVYDAFGNVVSSIAFDGSETKSQFNESGSLVRREFANGSAVEFEFDAVGNVVEQRDQLQRSTKYIYDALNRLVETIYPDETPDDDSDNPRQRIEYDAAGRETAAIDERGHRTEFEYDAGGRLILQRDALGFETQFEYDALGRQTRVVNALNQATITEFDAGGNPIRNVFHDGSSISAEFDESGNRTKLTDQNGRETQFEYDERGRLVAIVDALGQRTSYTYDGFGNRVATTDAKGQTTTQTFDGVGRPVSETLPEGQSDVRVYDAVGRLTQYTDFNGRTTEYEYDQIGQLTETKFADGSSEQFTYDLAGNLVSATNAVGTTTYQYDARDRLVRFEDADGQVISYAYDMSGNLLSQTSVNGTATYDYDAANQLVRATTPDGAQASYAYNAVGDLIETQLSNGITVTNTFDDLGRVTLIEHRDSAGNLTQRFDYDIDPTGRLTSVAELDGRLTRWTYDALYRLVQESSTAPAGPQYEIAHLYDAVGNRVRENHSDLGQRDFEYDRNNRLTRIVAPDGVSRYEYDDNGNLTAVVRPDGSRENLTWDAENQLVQHETLNAGVTTDVEFEYDATGNRIGRTVGGEDTRFLVDPNLGLPQVIAELDIAGNVLASYSFGLGRITQTQNGVTQFIGEDRHSGLRVLYDGSGDIEARFLYDGYGRELLGGASSSFLYRGEQRDFATGLDYLRARYYSPNTGSFISRDPFAGFNDSPLTLNEYLYTSGDPINNTDPTGEFGLTEFLVTFAKRNALNIALAVGFTAYRAYTEFKVSGFSATRLLQIAAQEAALAASFGLLGKALQTIRAAVNPAAANLLAQHARNLTGFQQALQLGFNSTSVARALQAVATASIIPRAVPQLVRIPGGGLVTAVVTQGKFINSRTVGNSFVRIIAGPGGKAAVGNGARVLVSQLNGKIGFATVVEVVELGFQSRIAANIPQFTALVGQLWFAASENGNPFDNLPVIGSKGQ